MFITKLKLVAAVVVAIAVVLTGSGYVAWQLSAQTPVAQQPPAKKDADALQGTWKVVSVTTPGKAIDPNEEAAMLNKPFTFKGNKVAARFNAEFTLDPGKAPKEIDVVPSEGPPNEKGQSFRGIYALKGDMLQLTLNGPGQPRPRTFDEMGVMAFVLKRSK